MHMHMHAVRTHTRTRETHRVCDTARKQGETEREGENNRKREREIESERERERDTEGERERERESEREREEARERARETVRLRHSDTLGVQVRLEPAAKFGNNLINVPANLKGPLGLHQHSWWLLRIQLKGAFSADVSPVIQLADKPA